MAVRMKRIYDLPASSDGTRILVDRLWPRGVSKEKAKIDEWARDIAPSDALRRWFGHKPERWEEFRKRYRRELASKERAEILTRIAALSRTKTVTVLFGAKDAEHCNARVILDELAKT